VKVESPCIVTDGAFVVNVTARDEADQLSPVATAVVIVIGNPECAPPPEEDDDDDDPDEGASKKGIGVGTVGSASGPSGTSTPFGSLPAMPGRSYAHVAAGRNHRHGARRRMH
jgi:hypothetical protein